MWRPYIQSSILSKKKSMVKLIQVVLIYLIPPWANDSFSMCGYHFAWEPPSWGSHHQLWPWAACCSFAEHGSLQCLRDSGVGSCGWESSGKCWCCHRELGHLVWWQPREQWGPSCLVVKKKKKTVEDLKAILIRMRGSHIWETSLGYKMSWSPAILCLYNILNVSLFTLIVPEGRTGSSQGSHWWPISLYCKQKLWQSDFPSKVNKLPRDAIASSNQI